MTPATIVLGQSTAVVGSVSPVGLTGRVVVQRGVHGRWSDRAASMVAADGSFRISIRPSQAGIYALRVRSNGGSVVSPVVYVRVKPSFAMFADRWGGRGNVLDIDSAGHGHLDFWVCHGWTTGCGGGPFDTDRVKVDFQLSTLAQGVGTGTVTGYVSLFGTGPYAVGQSVTVRYGRDRQHLLVTAGGRAIPPPPESQYLCRPLAWACGA